MACERVDRLIGGTRYRVTQFPAKQGRALLVRITKLLGPGLASALLGVGETAAASVEGAMMVGAAEAVRELCARLTVDEFGSILDEFAKYSTVVLPNDIEPRVSDVFDDHFAGKYDEMMQWLAFCMEANYKSFFSGAGGSAGLLTRFKTAFQASKSPTSSTGTSGVSRAANGTQPA